MKVPVVNQCCCGCTLEVGSKIIAWLGLIGSILYVIYGIIAIVGALIVEGVFMIIFALVGFALSLMLLLAINKRVAGNIRIWVIITTVLMVIFAIFALVNSIIVMVNGFIGQGCSMLIGALIGFAIEAYCIIVVHNFRREILGSGNV